MPKSKCRDPATLKISELHGKNETDPTTSVQDYELLGAQHKENVRAIVSWVSQARFNANWLSIVGDVVHLAFFIYRERGFRFFDVEETDLAILLGFRKLAFKRGWNEPVPTQFPEAR